jgi:L-aspartate oxidase
MTRHIDNIVETDGALILGAGVAGLFTALKLAPFPALVIAEGKPGITGSSAIAQGGIAASVGDGDDWRSHAADTVAAGAGLCDAEIADLVTSEAHARIDDLVRLGVPFDRQANGKLAVGREAAHACPRIVHVCGDRAGPEVMRTLAARAAETPSITLLEGFHAIELAMTDGRITGLFARTGSGAAARLMLFRASCVIFATGGLGALYAVTTNPAEVRGEGLGMAARAGALIGDPEFVQFHPTAIVSTADPAPLATEALRGHGAVLIDEDGRRFMPAVHPRAELAPRDVVARAIHRELAAGHKTFLDCRTAVGVRFADEFPTVAESCRKLGLDPAVQPIPVAPAAHYHMGGIATGKTGRSSLDGLWAVGECASTGLHGANRLASNSLLEGLVFGARAAEDVRAQAPSRRRGSLPQAPERFQLPTLPRSLRETMTNRVGLVRNAESLCEALRQILQIERAGAFEPALLNVTTAAKLVVAGAIARRESRGSHFRSDFSQTTAHGTRRFMTLTDAEAIAETALAGEQSAKQEPCNCANKK